MKKPLILFIICLTLLSLNLKSQVSVPNNFGAAANFVGWNALQAFPLIVQHQGNQQIRFLNNGFQRMVTNAGAGGVADGYTGNWLSTADFPENPFKIYPNPAIDQLNISIIPGKYNVMIIDVTGKILYERKLLGSSRIDISNLPNGLYFVIIQDGSIIHKQKLLIEQ